MLVLTRHADEIVDCELPTGETIRIHVLSIKGRYVKLGFSAPSTIQITRAEACDKNPLEPRHEDTAPAAVHPVFETPKTYRTTCQPGRGGENPESIV